MSTITVTPSPGNSPATKVQRVHVKVFPDSGISKTEAYRCRWEYTRQHGTELFIGLAVLHRRGIATFDLDLWRTDYELAPHAAEQLKSLWDSLAQHARNNGFRKTLTLGGRSICLQMEVQSELEHDALSALVSVLSNTENYVSIRRSAPKESGQR